MTQQREPLTNGKSEATPPPAPTEAKPQEQPKQQQPQQITLDNVNGRLAELADLNQMLTGRCATMRGELADKDRIITDLRAQLIAATGGKETVLKDKRKGQR